MSFQNGNEYKFINQKSSTAVDLSGSDNVSIVGFGPHEGPNQRWIAEENNGNFSFKNVSHQDKYLGFQGEPENGTIVVAVDQPQYWQPKTDDEGTRLYVPGTKYCLDLSDHGNANDNTPLSLWAKYKGGENQLWRFE